MIAILTVSLVALAVPATPLAADARRGGFPESGSCGPAGIQCLGKPLIRADQVIR